MISSLYEDNYFLNMKTTISSKGQIVLPVDLRSRDSIQPGQELAIKRLDEGEYLLKRPAARHVTGIVDFRGERVILDADLARLYGVETQDAASRYSGRGEAALAFIEHGTPRAVSR